MRRLVITTALALSVGACGVSTQEEVQLGQSYAQQINEQLPIVRDQEINRYFSLLGDSIAGLSDDRNLDWNFFIVDAPEVNAFAVPGGFIYINRGLIERTTNMAQLAGVLGHEIAHVTQRHSIDQMQQAQRADIGVTLACILTNICQSEAARAAIQIGGSAVFARFSRQDEAEADAIAIRNVMRVGIHPEGIPQMFETLLAERQRAPSGVEGWFSTHPLEEDRVAATRAAIAEIDPILLEDLIMDTPAYQAFRRRVQSLPPSPQRPQR